MKAGSPLAVVCRLFTLGALVVSVFFAFTPSASAQLVNGGFETGNLTGWTASPSSTGAVQVRTFSNHAGTVYTAKEGTYFAELQAGLAGQYSILSQAFTAASGSSVSGWVYFDAGDYLPYNDNGYVRVKSSTGAIVAELFFKNISQVGDYGSTPWTAFSYTFTSSGTFRIEAGIVNILDSSLDSTVGLDGVTLTGGNSAPVAQNGSLEVNEDTPGTEQLIATDANGDSLTYSISADAQHGSVTISGNVATYTPALNYFGPDSFSFRAFDGSLYSEPAVISITVAPVNDPPVAYAGTAQTNEDQTVAITLVATDVDNAVLTYSVVAGPAHGEVTLSGSSASYLSDLNYFGSDSFTFQASDGSLAATADVTITIHPVNDPPVANAGADQTSNEGSSVSFNGSFTDVDSTNVTFGWSFGDGGLASDASTSHSYADNGSYTAQLTVTDDGGLSGSDAAVITVNNVPPSIVSFTTPADPIRIGNTAQVNASFTDAGVVDTHSASVNWGDGTSSAATVEQGNGSGSAAASHVYAAAGVYTVSITVTDDDGGSASAVSSTYLVIYDPEGGFVTGGGWINSPAGAYVPDPSLTGKANFGFVSKYQKGATEPTGKTEFQFKAGNLNFHSSSYQWLVIAGPKAQYKGYGTINGAGEYGFMLTALDGQKPGGGGADKFRIKIWSTETGGVVYDNGGGAGDNQDPPTVLGGGSITIHD